MEINQAGLDLIKKWEGCKLSAYKDVAGIWTIGYGHIKDVYEGRVIDAEWAERLLKSDLSSVEETVVKHTSRFTSNQFSALVSLCFNIGNANFKFSTVLKEHSNCNYNKAADAFLMWDKAHIDGKLIEIKGLFLRRSDERNLYLTE